MSRVLTLRLHLISAFAVAAVTSFTAPAFAQSASCQEAQKFLGERQNLIQQINKLSGKDKKIDPRAACGVLGKLVANGDAGVKWLEANKDWCQVPDQFAEGFKQDHQRSKEMRSKACRAAEKLTKMEKQTKQGGNPFGGGLTGEYKIPQGAL